VAAAALKLLPVDPLDATGWVTSLHPDLEQMAAELADLTDPALIPAPGAPLIDAFAELHATRGMRLFHV
jgi:urease accessory protein